MSEPCITRGLIAHYLQAQGWTVVAVEGGFRLTNPRGKTMTWLDSQPLNDGIGFAIYYEGLDQAYELPARLGRCADVDLTLARARSHDVPGSASRQALRTALLDVATLILSDLGLTLRQWEEAR